MVQVANAKALMRFDLVVALGGWCLALLTAVAPARAAEPTGVLTLLDGEASVIIGARAVAAVPGLRLAPGSIVETSDKTGLLRVEWEDGSRVDLGPSTRVMIRPPGAPRTLVYLLRGIAKQTQDQPVAGQLSPAFEIKPFKGVVVTEVTAEGAVLFAEAGTESATGRRGSLPLSVKAGQAAVVQGEGQAVVQARPPAGWLAKIPRAFRDTLPSRLAQFQGPPPQAKPRPQPGHAEVLPWLLAEPLVRRELPRRWAEWLGEPAFRAAIVARLAQHPEWEPLVRPPSRPGERTAARRPADTPASAPESSR
jgi:hypothetical protein